MPWCEINQPDLSQSALSQHLAVLRESNVIVATRETQSIRYSLPDRRRHAHHRHPLQGVLRALTRLQMTDVSQR
jgi:DNA-binding transcriptional ArsR family regulator